MDGKLTINEAYSAMFAFLETYYDLTKADILGVLLGGLCLTEDGKPFDRANEKIWLDAVEKVKQKKVDTEFRLS